MKPGRCLEKFIRPGCVAPELHPPASASVPLKQQTQTGGLPIPMGSPDQPVNSSPAPAPQGGLLVQLVLPRSAKGRWRKAYLYPRLASQASPKGLPFRHGWPVAQVVCLFRQRCLHWALSCQACYKAAPHIWVLMSGISVSAITASRSARAYYEGTFIALTALCPCWTLAQCRLYIVRGL